MPIPIPPAPLTTITIHADAPGRNALAVEHDITVPLEQALAGIPGLAELRSVSRTDAALPSRAGYVQAHTHVAPGVTLDIELLLAPDERPDLTRPPPAQKPHLALDLDRQALARHGVAEPDLRTTLSAAIAGLHLGKLTRNGETLPVHLQLGEPTTIDPISRVAALNALMLPTASGSVPLSELVSFRATTQPHAIVRVDRHRAVEVEVQLTDPAALTTLQNTIAADLRLPPRYFVRIE